MVIKIISPLSQRALVILYSAFTLILVQLCRANLSQLRAVFASGAKEPPWIKKRALCHRKPKPREHKVWPNNHWPQPSLCKETLKTPCLEKIQLMILRVRLVISTHSFKSRSVHEMVLGLDECSEARASPLCSSWLCLPPGAISTSQTHLSPAAWVLWSMQAPPQPWVGKGTQLLGGLSRGIILVLTKRH